MKEKLLRAILLWCLVIGFAACANNDNESSSNLPSGDLKIMLQNTGQFYDITENPDTAFMKQQANLHYKEQYSMYFKQDMNHDDEGGEAFMQRVCILFRGFDRPTVLVTEGYQWEGFRDIKDLAANLDANVVDVEHRNFGKSYNQDQGKWQYQTIAQASADLHAIYQAMKPVFIDR